MRVYIRFPCACPQAAESERTDYTARPFNRNSFPFQFAGSRHSETEVNRMPFIDLIFVISVVVFFLLFLLAFSVVVLFVLRFVIGHRKLGDLINIEKQHPAMVRFVTTADYYR